jgi:hypothetical protein
MPSGNAESENLRRTYVAIVLCEAAILVALWLFQRAYS